MSFYIDSYSVYMAIVLGISLVIFMINFLSFIRTHFFTLVLNVILVMIGGR